MKTYLGKGGPEQKTSVYLTVDCLEIEEQHSIDITRRRIYLDDVVMVTKSRRFGWQYLLAVLVSCGLSAFVAAGLSFSSNNQPITMFFGAIALVFGILFLVRLIVRVHYITIFGRRKKVELVFLIRKQLMQESYDLIVNAVRQKIAASTSRVVSENLGNQSAEEMSTVSSEVVPDLEPAESFQEMPTPPPINMGGAEL